MEDLKKSLIDFVRKYKSSDYRKKRLLEDLEYVIHQMYAIPGPAYDRVGGTTNVKPDRMIMLLDKKDRIERSLVKIEEEKNFLNSFIASLTEKQREVFDWFFIQNEKITRISKYMNITYQAIEQIGQNPLSINDPKMGFWIQPTTHLYMRGMNIEKSVLILDECQNFFLDDCKKVFTRVHDDCLVIVIGHTGQNDLYKNKSHSGFAPYIEHFRNEPYVQVCELKNNYRGKFSQKADDLEIY